MDISDTLAPKSDQLDATDLAVSGPMTFTITSVDRGPADQPVQLALAEFPRVWRPGKSMRRVLAAAWGVDASQYIGRRVRLYCDPSVKFGGIAVGGTRIQAMSHIDKPLAVPLIVTKGKSAVFTVQPLPDTTPPSATLSAEQIAASTDVDWLRAQWSNAGPQQRERIKARVAELTASSEGGA